MIKKNNKLNRKNKRNPFTLTTFVPSQKEKFKNEEAPKQRAHCLSSTHRVNIC
uniref:Uncharacterized protein n=1 Tax=Tetranychus urticae TaxID=32264 RepID=T1KAM7_TETUR